MTRPSIPPASPHRAGHYSGLHPEDQPYQSSKIVVQRPPQKEVEQRRWQHEPEYIVLPSIETFSRRDTQYDATQPAIYNHMPARVTEPYKPAKASSSGRATSVLLTISCILFLLASSILAFTLINKRTTMVMPTVVVSPDIVRVHDTFTLSGSGFGAGNLLIFTHDANRLIMDDNGNPLEVHTNSVGGFSVAISVPADWQAGRHRLYVTDEAQQLSVTTSITVRAT